MEEIFILIIAKDKMLSISLPFIKENKPLISVLKEILISIILIFMGIHLFTMHAGLDLYK